MRAPSRPHLRSLALFLSLCAPCPALTPSQDAPGDKEPVEAQGDPGTALDLEALSVGELLQWADRIDQHLRGRLSALEADERGVALRPHDFTNRFQSHWNQHHEVSNDTIIPRFEQQRGRSVTTVIKLVDVV